MNKTNLEHKLGILVASRTALELAHAVSEWAASVDGEQPGRELRIWFNAVGRLKHEVREVARQESSTMRAALIQATRVLRKIANLGYTVGLTRTVDDAYDAACEALGVNDISDLEESCTNPTTI